MKALRFLFTGILFGIVLTKSEAISWFRIYEMFRFESFHMYGIIGSAVSLGILIVYLMKRMGLKSIEGTDLQLNPKEKTWRRYIIGGTIFGLGWALSGACPGPMYILIGNGFLVMTLVILSALFGTYLYGLYRSKLPH